MDRDILVFLVWVAIFIWLHLGFLGFGMAYAYMQRHYPNEQVHSVWSDYWSLISAVLWGPLNLFHVYLMLDTKGCWDHRKRAPLYGYKFLPRHERRYN